MEEPSTRCSFTDSSLSILDPRSPISITRISNDVTIPSIINEATKNLSINSLVIRTLGCPRSLVPIHNALLWKKAQNIAKKNNASETIKSIIPKFNPFCTARV